jgi:hypothetical protein
MGPKHTEMVTKMFQKQKLVRNPQYGDTYMQRWKHGAGSSTVPPQDVGNTSKPVDNKDAMWSRDSEFVRNLS